MHMLYIVAEEYFYSPLQIQSQNALNFYMCKSETRARGQKHFDKR